CHKIVDTWLTNGMKYLIWEDRKLDNCRHSAHSAFSVWCGLLPRNQPRNRLLHSIPFTLKGLSSRRF
ncbi:hypothetical protein N8648_04380, partial [Verrucomicrobia bacterium]|nr:hypothetical protein [Verrucomicrobiota bacterium]